MSAPSVQRARNKRRHARRDVELPVLVADVGADGEGRVHADVRFDASDLSQGGAFVRSSLLFEVGELLRLEISVPGGPPVRVKARVARVVRGGSGGESQSGMGVEFLDLDPADLDRILALVG